jgi:hypothetical protein
MLTRSVSSQLSLHILLDTTVSAFPPDLRDVSFGWCTDVHDIDPEEKFSFKEDPQLSYQEQWVAWQHGGLGPMQGQANHFFRLAPHRIQYPTQVRKNSNFRGLIHQGLIPHTDRLLCHIALYR